jgi:hypothetical protein
MIRAARFAPVAVVAALLFTRAARAEAGLAPLPVLPSAPVASTEPIADESSSAPASDAPFRHGFTMELGLGAALTNVNPDAGAGETQLGLAPLSIGVGGFVNRDVAVLARIAGTSYFDKNARGDNTQFVNGFYGVHVQYWFNDHLMISGGPGFTLFGENSFLGQARRTVSGYGASFRVAAGLLATKHHSLRVALEVFPSKYEKAFVMGSAVNLEWQYY